MMLIIRASRLSSYGKNVAKPRYEAKDSQFGKKILHVSESSFWPWFLVLSIVVTFWSFYDEVLAEPYYYPQDGQFAKTLSDAPESSFSARRTVTKKIADFQNSVTRL